MASAVIHLAVAKELEKYFNIKNKKDYYLGTIAPDIAKQIGKSKTEGHFLYSTKTDVPNIKMFTEKYTNFKTNDFNLGYFIHLYTDKIWFDHFIENFVVNSTVRLMDGTFLNCNEDDIVSIVYNDYTIIQTTPEVIRHLTYNDYTNLNIDLIDQYQLDLSLFYEDFQKPITTITEIPIDKLNVLIDQMGIIIENSTKNKSHIFDITLITEFINNTVTKILEELKNY